MILLILLFLLLFGFFGPGYWGRGESSFGYRSGGIGLGTILLLVLIVWLISPGIFHY